MILKTEWLLHLKTCRIGPEIYKRGMAKILSSIPPLGESGWNYLIIENKSSFFEDAKYSDLRDEIYNDFSI